jgi:hypothetical protein
MFPLRSIGGICAISTGKIDGETRWVGAQLHQRGHSNAHQRAAQGGARGKILGGGMIGMAAKVAHGSCTNVPPARK